MLTIALMMMFILGTLFGAFLMSLFISWKLWKDEWEQFRPYEGKDEEDDG